MKKAQFFTAMENLGLALSYDDVRLETDHSKVIPGEMTLTTHFSRRVTLNVPIVSSAMDTVTESSMAIALAKAGGIGVIHRNLTPKDQAAEVVRVKLHLNGRIMRPIYVFGDDTMEAIENRRREKNYSFRSFPVTDRSGKLIGLLTENDFVFCDNPKLTASAVMTKDVMTAPPETDLSTAYEKMRSHKKKVLLLVDGKGFIAGMYVFSDVKRIKTGNSAVFNTDSNGQLRVAAAIGTGDAELKRAEKLVRCGVDVLVIDTAHADTASVIEGTLKVLKQKITRTDIVVGNISRGSSARNLVDAGADGIKVGQGPGSICTTRIIAGIGCPQVTAIYNCAKAIEGSGVPVCADGGISHSGDIVVAVVAGAQTVMLGRLLAGTDEAPGNIVNIHGVPHKIYRGMGSLGAMQDNDASRKRYGERSTGKDQIVPEGIEGAVPYQGGVDKLLHQYVEGLQRGMGYVGAATIQELQEKGEFFRISPSGLAESHPHNVEYIQDAPNYKLTRKG